jgi:hypothetical protein
MTMPQPSSLSADGGSRAENARVGPVRPGIPAVARGPLGLPKAAWIRLVILFVALAAIKVALLFSLDKHLFDSHWRVESPELQWGDYIAFGCFVALGVASLWKLGRYCRSVGIRAVRAANAVVLALGLAFIFFSFHTGDKNYLYPILSGTLKWGSLGPYLSLDMFFRAPFLGAWLFGYGAIYYAFARTGRETWMFHATTICAGAFALMYLRGLAGHREALLVADCLGLVAISVGWRRGRGMALSWVLLPAVWSLIFAGDLLRLCPVKSGPSLVCLLIVVGTSLCLFGGATLLARQRGYLEVWGGLLFFYFASFLLLANVNYPVSENFNHTLCLGVEVPRYFAGEAMVAGALLFCAIFWNKIVPRGSWWWLDILSLAMIAIAFVDLRLTRIMGVRLDWGVLAMADKPVMMWRMARPYLPGVLAVLALGVVVYMWAVRRLDSWQKRREPGQGTLGNGLWSIGAMAVLLGILGLGMADPDKGEGEAAVKLAETSPLWKGMTKRTMNRDEFLARAKALGLGDLTAASRSMPSHPRREMNVVLVFMESTYNQHLSLFGGGEETEPLLAKYRDRMELFPNFFSDFASSIHARFAAFTSLYPAQDFHAFTMERVPVKSVFEVLHENGYACSLFYSSYFDYTGFGEFLTQRGLDEMYDADSMPGQRTTERVSWGLREEETLGAIRGQIQKYAHGGQRFFLTYVPAAPHYPYEKVPPAFHKFSAGEMGDLTPFYLNDLIYMDWVLASIVDELKTNGLLDKTLVVITDDHGEMLGAKGGPIGHGWLLSPELVNAPLIIMDPENPGYRVNPTVGSQVDLLPTLADRLGIRLPPGQLYEGFSLDAPERPADRQAYLNSFQQYGIVAGRQIVFGDRLKDKAHGSARGRTAFGISNDGAKTVFQCEPAPADRAVSIGQFDEFQESLLGNYSSYCQSIFNAAKVAARSKVPGDAQHPDAKSSDGPMARF